MSPPAICNGCGNESPAWDQLCSECSKEVKCLNCGKVYKRGQGLQEVNLCSSCLQEVFVDDVNDPHDITEQDDPSYGFDYQWELYDR